MNNRKTKLTKQEIADLYDLPIERVNSLSRTLTPVGKQDNINLYSRDDVFQKFGPLPKALRLTLSTARSQEEFSSELANLIRNGDGSCVVAKAAPGLGKTQAVVEAEQNGSLLMVSHRNAMVDSLGERLNLTHGKVNPTTRTGLCVDSISNLPKEPFDTVLVDEPESLLLHIYSWVESGKSDSWIREKTNRYCEHLRSAKKVIVLDAHLTGDTAESFSRIANKPLTGLQSGLSWQADTPLELYHKNQMADFIDEVKRSLDREEKTVICTDSDTKAMEFAKQFAEHKPIIYTGSSKAPDLSPSSSRLLIHTQAIDAAVSLHEWNGANVFGIFSMFYIDSLNVIQMLGRVRKPSSRGVIITSQQRWVQKFGRLDTNYNVIRAKVDVCIDDEDLAHAVAMRALQANKDRMAPASSFRQSLDLHEVLYRPLNPSFGQIRHPKPEVAPQSPITNEPVGADVIELQSFKKASGYQNFLGAL